MARRFVFRLQPVLEQRERVEQEQQRRVAGIERERIELEGRLRTCQARIIAAKQELREHIGAAGGVVRVEAVRMQSNASLHLAVLAQRTAIELAGVYRQLEAARAELGRATAARKAVTLLKDRQFEEWKRDVAKREASEADELVVMRYGREERES